MAENRVPTEASQIIILKVSSNENVIPIGIFGIWHRLNVQKSPQKIRKMGQFFNYKSCKAKQKYQFY